MKKLLLLLFISLYPLVGFSAELIIDETLGSGDESKLMP